MFETLVAMTHPLIPHIPCWGCKCENPAFAHKAMGEMFLPGGVGGRGGWKGNDTKLCYT